MYYVFSNWKRLRYLSKEKMFEELAEEFKKTEMIKISEHKDVNPSAKETYRYICHQASDINEDVFALIHEHAVKMFVENRDIEALLMISENPLNFGTLEGESYELVKAYNDAKSIALEFFKNKAQENPNIAPFDAEVESVNVKFDAGRLSFKFDGNYRTIFYGL